MEEITTVRPSLTPATIRPMHPADIDNVLSITAALPTAPRWPRETYLDALDTTHHPPRLALVAEADSEILGFIVVSLLSPEAELESVAVAPQAQRQGIARQLLEAAITTIRSLGVHTLFLEIRASNHPAAALYSRAGFRETGRRPNYYSAPTEDAILMQLNLL